MLDDYFRQILDRFESEKTKSFKDNDLVFKIRNDLSKEVLKLLDDDFVVRSYCGVNSWPESPWVRIIDKSFDSAQEALVLQYNFDTLNRELSFSLILRLKDVSEYTLLKDFLTRTVEGIDLNDFIINKNDTSSVILSKNYSYSQINDEILKGDLESIIPVYRKLSYEFKYFQLDEDEECCEMSLNEHVEEDMPSRDELCDADYIYVTIEKELSHSIAKTSIADISIDYREDKRYENNLNNPKELFTDESINRIIRCDITSDDYNQIIKSIKENSKRNLTKIISDYNLDLNELKIKDKILLYSKSFVKTEYKSIGKLLGSYSFSEIRVDDRLSTPLIITSIIHELAHFMLEKILKEILMKVLDTNDTPLISSYVKILLEDNDLNYLLDEFSAHTVEGRFALYGYQDYASFKYKLDEISHLYSKEDIDYALILANTFAYDIKDILEEYIVFKHKRHSPIQRA